MYRQVVYHISVLFFLFLLFFFGPAFSEYFCTIIVSYEEIFPRHFGAGGVKTFPWKISSGAHSEHLGPSLTIQEFFKKIFLVLYAAYFVVREEGMGWCGKTLMEEQVTDDRRFLSHACLEPKVERPRRSTPHNTLPK